MSTEENKEKTAMAQGTSVPGAKVLKAPLSRAIGSIGRQKGIWEARRREQGSWEKHTYHANAGRREYYVYTPAHYQPGSAVPLLVMLHGCDEGPRDFAASTQMNELADQQHFIVVYPRQTIGDQPLKCWTWYNAANQCRDRGEAALLAGITQAVQHNTARWTIDPQRVYVAGLSAGAAMAVILGATYPDLFAAIGVHSGLEYHAATTGPGAVQAMQDRGPDPLQQGHVAYQAMGHAARVVPTIVFHGTHDLAVHPVNGDQVVQQWMETDRLVSQGAYTARFDKPSSDQRRRAPGGRSYRVKTWTDASGKVVQAYWTVEGMGHAWSGGRARMPYSDPHGPNASLAMYQFFVDH